MITHNYLATVKARVENYPDHDKIHTKKILGYKTPRSTTLSKNETIHDSKLAEKTNRGNTIQFQLRALNYNRKMDENKRSGGNI